MKNLLTILFAVALMSCGGDDATKSSSTTAPSHVTPTEAVTPPPIQNNNTTAPGTVNIPAGADGIVHHYVCPDQCEGGNGAGSGPCPVCGKQMSHNQAFHNQNQPTITTNPTGAAGATAPAAQSNKIDVTNPNAAPIFNNTVSSATAPTPEPAQNANGVWHYICNNGCTGGAGSATACAGCGSTLVHNAAYHN